MSALTDVSCSSCAPCHRHDLVRQARHAFEVLVVVRRSLVHRLRVVSAHLDGISCRRRLRGVTYFPVRGFLP